MLIFFQEIFPQSTWTVFVIKLLNYFWIHWLQWKHEENDRNQCNVQVCNVRIINIIWYRKKCPNFRYLTVWKSCQRCGIEAVSFTIDVWNCILPPIPQDLLVKHNHLCCICFSSYSCLLPNQLVHQRALSVWVFS